MLHINDEVHSKATPNVTFNIYINDVVHSKEHLMLYTLYIYVNDVVQSKATYVAHTIYINDEVHSKLFLLTILIAIVYLNALNIYLFSL